MPTNISSCMARQLYLGITCLLLQSTSQGWVMSARKSNGWRTLNFQSFPSPRGQSIITSLPAVYASNPERSLIDAFAGLTQSSCKLLGVKSIGIDYGLVRTGIARTAGYQPQAVEILADLNSTEVSDRVVQLARLEGGVSKLIVGLPLHKNGTVAEQTNLTLAFAQILAEVSLRTLGPNVTVELWDERYTSKEAAARAHARNPHQTLYGMLDAEAACIILEQYYNDNGKDAHVVQVQDDQVRAACLAIYQQQQEAENAQKRSYLEERQRLLQRRQQAILRDQQAAAAAVSTDGKKKKKKKRKK